MCFNSSKKTSITTPANPAVTAATTGLVNSATSLASRPYQPYTGSLVAPLTDLQNQAISQIQGAGSLAQPYLTQAAQYATQSATPITTTPFSQSAIDQYYSPYQNDVVNATQNLINQQNKEQQQSLAGNITAAGAWGGDRSAVLQAELARQQDLAGNATLANLENQGYTQALGQFNTGNNLSLSRGEANNASAANAATTLGSIGTSIQNSALNGAGALLNAGTLQQQVNQENLNVPYEQYLAAQGYPYQQLGFLSGILGTAAGTAGSTTTQTQSTPLGPQLLGAGLTAASFLRRGGRARLADGGYAYAPLPVPLHMGSYIPAGTASGGSRGLTAASFGGDGGDDPYAPVQTGAAALGKSLADGGLGGDGALTLDQTPPEWQSLATNFAPDQETPAWDDGEPVAAGASLAHAPRILPNIYQPKPDWREALRAAGAGMLAAHTGTGWGNVGAGLAAGAQNYNEQEEKDRHPEVDHSGPTTLVRYADGTVVDTGIPTEAAINADAMNQYRMSNMKLTQQEREDAIAQRREAAQQAADDRAESLRIAAINAGAGRWAYAGVDPATGRPVLLDAKTGQTHLGNAPIAAKPTAPKTLSPTAALVQARKDYAFWQNKDADGNVYNADGSKANPDQWITNRAAKYISGAARIPGTMPPTGGNAPVFKTFTSPSTGARWINAQVDPRTGRPIAGTGTRLNAQGQPLP